MTDLRHTLRRLRKSPGFTLLTIMTLALGIGATTAMFSVVNGVLLEPLPFDGSENLVYISGNFLPESGRDVPDFPVGSPEYFDYRNQNRTMEEVAAVSTDPFTIVAGQGQSETVRGGRVSPSMFTLLRTPPLLGRALIEGDGGAEPAHVVVLSYDLWQRRFGGDSTVVGSVIDLDVEFSEEPAPTEIVGVMPPGFTYPGEGIQLWAPLVLDPARTWRGGHWFRMVGRLAQGVTFKESELEMRTLMEQWAVAYPDHHVGHGLFMQPLLEREVGEAKATLLLLLGAVGFVLLIACANVANLLLARSEGRRREIAIRGALGASRGRLFQEVLTESLVLAILGGGGGLLLAWVGVNSLLALEPGNLPRVDQVGIDGGVLAFTAGAVVLTTLLFGLIPALRVAAPKPGDTLRDGSLSTTAGTHRMRVRKGIVVAEVAVSVLMVVGAGLMARSLRNLLKEDPGFRTENLLFARFSLPPREFAGQEAALFYGELMDRAARLPGALRASQISRPPFLYEHQTGQFHILGEEEEPCCVGGRIWIGDELLDLLGVRVLRGRGFDEGDFMRGAPRVALIDEAAAQRYFPSENPVGKRLIVGGGQEENYSAIVGVVGNVTFDGPGMVFPTIYFPMSQAPQSMALSSYLVVRTAADAEGLVEPLRRAVMEIDSRQAIVNTYTMDGMVARSVARPRFTMVLLSLFSGVALLLGAIGIYGVISYGVALRAGEIGIRRALGAKDAEVMAMVVKQGMSMALIGLGIGLFGSLFANRTIEGFLFEVRPTDPMTFALVGLGVILVALAAAYLPARRAVEVDPLEALKGE